MNVGNTYLCSDRQTVVDELFVAIEAGRVLFQAAFLDDTFLVLVTERETVVAAITTATVGNVVVLGIRCAENLILPVCIRTAVYLCCRNTRIVGLPCSQETRAVEQVILFGDRADTQRVVVRKRSFAGSTFFVVMITTPLAPREP